MHWFLLFLAGLLEIAWALGLKYTDGFTRHPVAGAATGVSMIASMLLLGMAMRSLPVGTAYAVWTGIGTVGTVLFGILWFGESAAFARLCCIAMIVIGIVGLKLLTNSG